MNHPLATECFQKASRFGPQKSKSCRTGKPDVFQNQSTERNPLAKTNAQLEKRKRETEKRKKTEKAILKKAAEAPEDDDVRGTNPTEHEIGNEPGKA